jgi:hypothetical protein
MEIPQCQLLGYIIMFETPLKMAAQLLRHYPQLLRHYWRHSSCASFLRSTVFLRIPGIYSANQFCAIPRMAQFEISCHSANGAGGKKKKSRCGIYMMRDIYDLVTKGEFCAIPRMAQFEILCHSANGAKSFSHRRFLYNHSES